MPGGGTYGLTGRRAEKLFPFSVPPANRKRKKFLRLAGIGNILRVCLAAIFRWFDLECLIGKFKKREKIRNTQLFRHMANILNVRPVHLWICHALLKVYPVMLCILHYTADSRFPRITFLFLSLSRHIRTVTVVSKIFKYVFFIVQSGRNSC